MRGLKEGARILLELMATGFALALAAGAGAMMGFIVEYLSSGGEVRYGLRFWLPALFVGLLTFQGFTRYGFQERAHQGGFFGALAWFSEVLDALLLGGIVFLFTGLLGGLLGAILQHFLTGHLVGPITWGGALLGGVAGVLGTWDEIGAPFQRERQEASPRGEEPKEKLEVSGERRGGLEVYGPKDFPGTPPVLPGATLARARALARILQNPKAWEAFSGGARPPRGAVLYGPPGTGKTYLTRYIAHLSGRPVILLRPDTVLRSPYMGEAVKAIKEAYEEAKRLAPSILLLDEMDATLPARGGTASDTGGAVREWNAVTSFLLQVLDGPIEEKTPVFIIGTTNRLEALDPALLSRMTFTIEVPLPGREAREEILKRELPPPLKEHAKTLALLTEGFSGRDLAEVVRKALVEAFGRGKSPGLEDLMAAVEETAKRLEEEKKGRQDPPWGFWA